MAIGAQQIDRAKTFGEKHGISTVYGSYEELSQNGDIGEHNGIFSNIQSVTFTLWFMNLSWCTGSVNQKNRSECENSQARIC